MSDGIETEQKEEIISSSKNSSMIYVMSAILLIIVVGGGIYFMSKNSSPQTKVLSANVQSDSTPKPQRPDFKGQKLSDTRFADSAYQIYPGTISESAKAAMSGWDLKTTQNSDGTVTATLIPVGSEAAEGDSMHTYTLQLTDKLYFVDLNPGDDQPGMDNNKNDDLGIVVNSDGIIQ